MRISLGGCRASDDAVILPGNGSDAKAIEFLHRRRRPLRIAGRVPDEELERPAGNAAGVIDIAHAELESGKQVSAGLDPAGAAQRHQGAELDCGSVSHPCRCPYENAARSIAGFAASASG